MEKGDRRMQYIATIVVNLASFATGAATVWTSPVIPLLSTPGYSPLDREVSNDETMWMGSLLLLGNALAPFGTVYMSDQWGRKVTLLLSGVPFVVGWLLVWTTTTVIQIYVGRFLHGLGCGFVFTAVPMYVAEISEEVNRGSLGSYLQLFVSLGMLFGYSLGPYVGYTMFAMISTSVPVLFIVAFWFMPESPYFYFIKGRTEDALRSLAKFRGKTTGQVENEAKIMQIAVEEEQQNRGSYLDLVRIPGNRKALFLSCSLIAFLMVSGINVILMYSATILGKSSKDLSPEIMTIIMGFVQVVAAVITPLVVDRMGRRVLMMLSAMAMGISIGALGLYFYLDDANYDIVEYLNWLPVLSESLFISSACLGMGILPFVVMGEMFPTNVKSQAGAVTIFVGFGIAFLEENYFEALVEEIGLSTTFWIFAAFCFAAVFFVYFLLPETRGLTFQEIQDKLTHKADDNKLTKA